MVKTLCKCTALILILVLLALPVQAAQAVGTEETCKGLSALGGKPGTLLSAGEDFPAGTSVCDWVVMALALSGSEEHYDTYREALQNYVEENYALQGGLDSVKSTTYHRISLVVLALGGDPEHFGKKPDGTDIDLIADGTYGFAGTSLGNQGLNGWIYALLSLDASGVEVPQQVNFTREDMLRAIVSAQEPDGGFGLAPGKSDVDISAMALQALAPYVSDYPETVEAGIAYLANAMDENCRFSAYGEASAESSAQVILALCALGIDPEEDGRFSRGNGNLLTALEVFRREDGTYGHTPQDETGNFLATAQVLLALRALEKFRSGEGWIFDFTDYTPPQEKTQSAPIYLAAAAAAAALMICIVIVRKRRQHGKNNG